MSTPNAIETCSVCGGAKAAGGPCAHCLLQLGLAYESGRGPRRPRRAPPAPADIAPHFPGLEIEAVIGHGGMGVVYRARQRKLGRLVALKILAPELSDDPAFAERFLREARAMARLEHRNIVAVHDFGETDGLCWILMEHVEGLNLRQLLASGRLAPAQALAIVPQLCDALAAAHAQGVVHRDIKPENVMIAAEGVVKVADFGLAKLSGPGLAEPALTQSDAAMGTLHYMAPEQLVGAREVDHRADIYSLGVVFYEMLTGELPLGRFEPPSQRADVDAGVDDIVLRSLARAPERRYQQAVEVKTDVQGLGRRAPKAKPERAAAPAVAEAAKSRASGTDVGLLAFTRLVLLLGVPTLARVLLGLPGGLVWSSLALALLFAFTLLAFAQRDARLALSTWSHREMLARCLGCIALAALAFGALQYGVIALWEEGTDHFRPSTNPLRLEADVARPGGLLAPFETASGGAVPAEAPTVGPHFDPFLRVHGVDGRALTLVGFLLASFSALFFARRDGQTSLGPLVTAPLVVALTLLYSIWRFDGAQLTWNQRSTIAGEARVDGAPRAVREALQSVCERRGYEVVLVAGTKVGFEALAVQPAAWSERWRLEKGGPRRLKPGVVFALASSGTGDTKLAWDAGEVLSDERRIPEWRSEVESLLAEARRELGG